MNLGDGRGTMIVVAGEERALRGTIRARGEAQSEDSDAEREAQ